ncbi:hypothetical protein D9Q98_004402 [Chlorella vulgaris]|uniref:Protein kinase domain-containing protein n=1 Tax=Chlorella vulgaris TaxID=3077 RepID=A0A9D4YXW2_CHLVU|nr:hypothetical protein D9Q98_004402 [Chlorella vulgaris]
MAHFPPLAHVRVDIAGAEQQQRGRLPGALGWAQAGPSPSPSPRSPNTATSLFALRDVWRSLSAASRILLLLGTAQALTAATFAVIQFAQDWQLLLQDTALILCSAVLTLGLLLDAFVRENAFQLLACLALGVLNASQLIVYLATAQGQGERGAAATVAICLVLQLAAMAVARPAYMGFGWRMYSRIASNWRLKPAEQQQLRDTALARQRFAGAARADGLVLTLLLIVVAINAANPGGGSDHPQPLGLLVGAAAAALPLCAGWLAGCWAAARCGRRWLAIALDFAYPLCYIPPLLVVFAGATLGGSLSQPHGQAYLILYAVLFLGARTATWWASRQLSAAQHAQHQHGKEDKLAEPLLPPELLPLARGAWLLKLPSSSAGSRLGKAGSLGLDAAASGSSCGSTVGGGGCWSGGGSQEGAGRQRFFQLSHDASCLRWHWKKWVLCAHIEGIKYCDESQTISLQLMLEPDLRLKFPVSRQYSEWRDGLQLLLALLLAPDELVPAMMAGQRRSSTFSTSSDVAIRMPASPRVSVQPTGAAALAIGTSPFLQPCDGGSEGWQGGAATAAGTAPKQRVCSRNDSRRHLEAATARSQAAIAAAVQRQTEADHKLAAGGAGTRGDGQAGRPTGTIQLFANAAFAPAPLLMRGSTSAQREAHQNTQHQQQTQQHKHARRPGGRAVERLRSGLLRAATLPASLWRASAPGPPRTGSSGSLQPGASPSKQPLTSRMHPSSSREDLQGAQQAQQAQQHQDPELQHSHQQPSEGAEPAPHHERRLTLGEWAEQEAPPLQLPSGSELAPRRTLSADGQPPCDEGLPRSPFIHLHAFSRPARGGPSQSPRQCSPHQPGPAPSGPSLTGSEASTPRYLSPQRGSPNRQQQLHSFQAYLQQQLLQQQRGRCGPHSSDASAVSCSGAASDVASTATSPMNGSPCKRHAADAAQHSTVMSLPPADREAAAAAGASHRLSQLSTSRGGPAGNPLGPAQQRDAVPPLSSAFNPAATSSAGVQLARADSTFSSWGLATPTTAAAQTPFGVSRLNSLAHTPLSTYRQHASFAASHQQQQQAGAALLTAASGLESGRGGGSRNRQEGQADESDSGVTSRNVSFSAPSVTITSALGINVPVEMVDFRDLVFGKFLGEGAEGSVYAAWYRETPVAVKRTSSLMEVEMNLHAGAHDNIVGLRGLCSHGSHLYLIMELCPRGTLDVLIHKGAGSSHPLDPHKLLPIVRSIARGMLHLHTRRPAVFHRDLKPGNCFIGHGGVVKVGDFGMSRYATAQWRTQEADGALERTLTPGVIGTAAYSAPELLNPESPEASDADRQATSEVEERIAKADVYSFGVTLWEIMERKRPFAGMDGFQIQTQWYLDPQGMRLPPPVVPEDCPPAARLIMDTLVALVASCTHWDPDQRPNFQTILATLRTAAGGGGGGSTAPPTPAASLVNPF